MELLTSIIFSLLVYPQLPPPAKLPVNPDKAVGRVVEGTIYAYNSEVGQTDNDPFITASGQQVRKGIIANNCLKFGTVVRVDGKVYEVLDRMNSRYGCEVFDIWMESKAEAKQWGKQSRSIIIY